MENQENRERLRSKLFAAAWRGEFEAVKAIGLFIHGFCEKLVFIDTCQLTRFSGKSKDSQKPWTNRSNIYILR